MDRERIIIEEFGGVIPYHEVFYIRCIALAAGKGIEAFEWYRHLIAHDADAALTVFELQEALSHAAAVSRFFWPASSVMLAAARGLRLRDAFGMAESNPLADRRLRNAIEHFDERLDRFLTGDPTGYLFDLLIDDQLSPTSRQHIF